jgi:antitoxin component YwqK of YwqJK toxin-antitoxin module
MLPPFLSVITGCSNGKEIYSKVPFNRVTYIKNDTLFQFFTKPGDEKAKINISENKYYAWYKADSIVTTRGSYSGKLLHGDYEELYPSRALKQKGKYKDGLKVGKWETWFPNGEIETITNWNSGIKEGIFEIYNSEGKLQKSGNYKSGKENGEVSEFLPEGKIHKILYKQGEVVSDMVIDQVRL